MQKVYRLHWFRLAQLTALGPFEFQRCPAPPPLNLLPINSGNNNSNNNTSIDNMNNNNDNNFKTLPAFQINLGDIQNGYGGSLFDTLLQEL